jgi:HAMP domain-containing protein
MAPYPLYDLLFPQQPSILSTALCLLFSPFPLYGPLSSLGPLPSTALCLLYSSFPLYDHLSPLSSLRPSVPSTALCPSTSTALCPLYGPLSPLKNSETSGTALLFREMFCKTRFVKTLRVNVIYFVLVIITIIAIITIITEAKYSAIIAKEQLSLWRKKLR